MATAGPGWYADPSGRFEYRYWDGTAWTQRVGAAGREYLDAPQLAPEAHQAANVQETQGVDEGQLPQVVQGEDSQNQRTDGLEAAISVAGATLFPIPEATESIGLLNVKKIAAALQPAYLNLLHQTNYLRSLVSDQGTLEAVDISERNRLIVEESMNAARVAQEEYERAYRELQAVRAELVEVRDTVSFQQFGLYDYEHPAEHSVRLGTELEALRSRIKDLAKSSRATSSISGFMFNNSRKKGDQFVKKLSDLMLSAYNAEVENAIVKLKRSGQLEAAQKRISRVRDRVAKNGSMINLQITNEYHSLRLHELELAARHRLAVELEKEAEKERRAELREEIRAQAEFKRERERLERERQHYQNSIARLREAGDLRAADALERELNDIDEAIKANDYRAANIRAGYVYVISNVGAFGEGVIKIGMTRRLEPMDRVRELSDASVPFNFDVHALFFADDAVGVEAMLHRHFAKVRINKVNLRREFFYATPDEVLAVLAEHKVAVLEFDTHAEAEQYRSSWPEGRPISFMNNTAAAAVSQKTVYSGPEERLGL